LAEFIVEWTPTQDEEIPETSLSGKEATEDSIMYFDGAFLLQDAGVGVLLVAPLESTSSMCSDAFSQGESHRQYC
jgi:hypothetical protein